MTGNGLSVVSKSADMDIAVTDSYGQDSVYGFRFAQNSKLVRSRGSSFAGQISSGAPTYNDGTPFKLFAFDNALGGMGQPSYNNVNGGVGLGGDETKYLYGDCWSLRGGYILPGMARNQIYNTVANVLSQTPITTLGASQMFGKGDEQEVPKGVLPSNQNNAASGGALHNTVFTPDASVTITGVRLLVYLPGPFTPSTSFNVTCTLADAGGSVTFTSTVTGTIGKQTTGWKWLTLTGSKAITSGTPVTLKTTTGSLSYSVGCYCIGTDNVMQPYFQLMTTATPFKYWSSVINKVEHINDAAGNYANIALFNTAFVNTANTTTAGSAATSPERTYPSGNYQGSIWLNSKLYVFTSTGTFTMNYAQATATGAVAPTDALSATVIGSSPVGWGGFIYYVTANGLGISKWNGVYAPAPTQIVADDTIGDKGSLINRLFVFDGNLWVIKPEGVFQLYADPTKITTAVGDLARINPQGDPMPSINPNTGKWMVIHQGSIFFNYKDRVYQMTPQATGPVQVTPLAVPQPLYRMSYYHYVNGLASDGVNLYVSYSNLGVFAYINQVWHPVTEFYETTAGEGAPSGLRWIPDPAAGPDSLFVGDKRTLCKIPIPSQTSPYSSQIFQNHQNKCGYLILSAWDANQANTAKYIQSVLMQAWPSTYRFKVVAHATNTTAGLVKDMETTFLKGLYNDNWINPLSSQWNYVVTQFMLAGNPQANSAAPACFDYTDFTGQLFPEKLAATTQSTINVPPVTDVTYNKPVFSRTVFVVYWWNTVPNQYIPNDVPLMAIDTVIVKYQSILDYIPLYRVSLSCNALCEGTGLNLTTTQAEDSWAWLAQQFGRHEPVKITIQYRKDVNNGLAPPTFGVKTFYGILQSPVDTTGQYLMSLDNNAPLAERVDLEILGTQGEYVGV